MVRIDPLTPGLDRFVRTAPMSVRMTLCADLDQLSFGSIELSIGELALGLDLGEEVLVRDGATELTMVVEQLDTDAGLAVLSLC